MGPCTGAQGVLRLLRDTLRASQVELRIAQPQLSERVRRGEFRFKG
jgi:hypothetical protein